MIKIGRVTLSDRASAGVYVDRSGPEIERILREAWGDTCEFLTVLIPDEVDQISAELTRLADVENCALIVTTGGTGPSRRDVTPEATRAVLEKELPGFGEIQRMQSFATVPTSILTRATGGVRGCSLIVNLPGNPKAVRECLPLLLPAMREAMRHLAGD